MKHLLLVTWFVAGQPPNSYQANFDSAEACGRARLAILFEVKRLKDEAEKRIVDNATDDQLKRLMLMQAKPPTASAICVVQ